MDKVQGTTDKPSTECSQMDLASETVGKALAAHINAYALKLNEGQQSMSLYLRKITRDRMLGHASSGVMMTEAGCPVPTT
jgi:hypothetical protein